MHGVLLTGPSKVPETHPQRQTHAQRHTPEIHAKVQIGSKLHDRLIACGVIHLLVYGAGFMAVCAYGLIRLRLRAQAEHAKGQRAMLWFRFLYLGTSYGVLGCSGGYQGMCRLSAPEQQQIDI